MTYLLDTNICIYLIKHKPPMVRAHFSRHQIGDIGISSITLAELEYGAAKSQFPERNREALYAFSLPLEVHAFDEEAAHAYGKLRAILERQGQVIGAMDLMIAAHALSLRSVLVTNNEREFRRVPDLAVENWAVSL